MTDNMILMWKDLMAAMGIYGKTYKETPNVIYVGPNAFVSETELATTIAHELNHARIFLKGRRAPEKRRESQKER